VLLPISFDKKQCEKQKKGGVFKSLIPNRLPADPLNRRIAAKIPSDRNAWMNRGKDFFDGSGAKSPNREKGEESLVNGAEEKWSLKVLRKGVRYKEEGYVFVGGRL